MGETYSVHLTWYDDGWRFMPVLTKSKRSRGDIVYDPDKNAYVRIHAYFCLSTSGKLKDAQFKDEKIGWSSHLL